MWTLFPALTVPGPDAFSLPLTEAPGGPAVLHLLGGDLAKASREFQMNFGSMSWILQVAWTRLLKTLTISLMTLLPAVWAKGEKFISTL